MKRIDPRMLGALDLDALATPFTVGSWREDAEPVRSEAVRVSDSLWLHPRGIQLLAKIEDLDASDSWV